MPPRWITSLRLDEKLAESSSGETMPGRGLYNDGGGGGTGACNAAAGGGEYGGGSDASKTADSDDSGGEGSRRGLATTGSDGGSGGAVDILPLCMAGASEEAANCWGRFMSLPSPSTGIVGRGNGMLGLLTTGDGGGGGGGSDSDGVDGVSLHVAVAGGRPAGENCRA